MIKTSNPGRIGRVGVRGFTLVELAVVVVLIGLLAAFGVPMLLESAERSRAAEAFAYLSAVQEAQERYADREGEYADHIAKLDFQAPELRYFELTGGGTIDRTGGGLGLDDPGGWSLTLTRIGDPSRDPSCDGQYAVVFTQDGFSASSTIPESSRPRNP